MKKLQEEKKEQEYIAAGEQNTGDNEPVIDINWFNKRKDQVHPKPPLYRNIILAFVFGGIVSIIGQLFLDLFIWAGLPEQEAGNPTVAVIIFLAALITGFGVFDRIARIAGAGVAIPVTGFANSVTAMAIEFKREGLVQGTGSKMFTLAGSIIVFGVVTAFVIGLISAII